MKAQKTNFKQQEKQKWFEKLTGRKLHSIGAILAGIWLATNSLQLLWPDPDQIHTNTLFENQLHKTKSPNTPIRIMLIGLQKIEHVENIHLRNITLIYLNKIKSMKIIDVPVDLSIYIKNRPKINMISKAYEEGNVALTYDILSKILRIDSDIPKRYIIGDQTIIDSLLYEVEKNNPENTYQLITSAPQQTDKENNLNKIQYPDPIKLQKSKAYIQVKFKRETQKIDSNSNTDPSLNNKGIKLFTKEILKKVETNLSLKEFISANSILFKQK